MSQELVDKREEEYRHNFAQTYAQLVHMGRGVDMSTYQEIVDVVTRGLPEGEDVWAWLLTH